MGETAEDCQDPLALLDPKEELLSETESMEEEGELEEDKTDGQSSTDIKHKNFGHSPVMASVAQTTTTTTTASLSTTASATITKTTLDCISTTTSTHISNNNGKFYF